MKGSGEVCKRGRGRVKKPKAEDRSDEIRKKRRNNRIKKP